MFLENLLFPKFCVGRGFLGCYLCPSCQKELSYIENDVCLYCGHPSLLGLTHPNCQKKHGIDGAAAIFHYNNVLKKVIKSVKYRLATAVWKEVVTIIRPKSLEKTAGLKKLNRQFLLQPLPLHKDRERVRGFNQARLIADFFNTALHVPVVDYLKRQKSTLPQAQISKSRLRFKNIAGAFSISSAADVPNGSFILVDDVATSGLTLKEAAKELKKSGAAFVYGLTLAKG